VDHAAELDAYAEAYGKLAQAAWEQGYEWAKNGDLL